MSELTMLIIGIMLGGTGCATAFCMMQISHIRSNHKNKERIHSEKNN